MDLFSLSAQCCDATEYLSLGEVCAATGNCYHALRPMGAVYWFSLPYQFGLNPSILIALHGLLAIVSIWLSISAIRNIISSLNKQAITRTETILLATISVVAHMIFLIPTFTISLTDTPASLLFLIAIWLIVIGIERKSILLMMAAGLCLGLSTWLRVFFYYPVILIAMMSCIFYVYENDHKSIYAAVLTCLLPIAFQVGVTASHTSHYTFLDPSRSSPMMAAHLGNPVIGYDTIDQGHPMSWNSSCGEIEPFSRSISKHDYRSITCLLAGRLNFYLGSYSTSTYHILTGNYLKKVEVSELKRHQQTRMIHPSDEFRIHAPLYLEKSRTYELHADIWNEFPNQHILEFFIASKGSTQKLSSNIFFLSPDRNNASIVAEVPESGTYDFVIQLTQPGPETEIGRAIIWEGIVINKEPFYIGNVNIYEDTRPPVRYWSTTLLLIHLVVLVCAIALLWKIIQYHLQTGLYIALLFLTTSGMALIIVPEQRFVTAPMILIWIFFFAWIATILPSTRTRPLTEKDHA